MTVSQTMFNTFFLWHQENRRGGTGLDFPAAITNGSMPGTSRNCRRLLCRSFLSSEILKSLTSQRGFVRITLLSAMGNLAGIAVTAAQQATQVFHKKLISLPRGTMRRQAPVSPNRHSIGTRRNAVLAEQEKHTSKLHSSPAAAAVAARSKGVVFFRLAQPWDCLSLDRRCLLSETLLSLFLSKLNSNRTSKPATAHPWAIERRKSFFPSFSAELASNSRW